ncbi:MAG: HAD-IA family hydrolase [Ethanoligenens sp.]
MIKAILFDSGKVLNYPTTGHWFISPHFYDIVGKDIFEKIGDNKVRHAFENAAQYIDSITHIQDNHEELARFTEFYNIFSHHLPELELDGTRVKLLAEDIVSNPEKYTFYPDVYSVIPALSEKYKLGIVSDAWPSLIEVYEHAGLKKYFSTIIISSVLGTQKPDRRMYETALEHLGVGPQETIFIDDSSKNCEGAKKIGIKPYLLYRNAKGRALMQLYGKCKGYTVISSLTALTNV